MKVSIIGVGIRYSHIALSHICLVLSTLLLSSQTKKKQTQIASHSVSYTQHFPFLNKVLQTDTNFQNSSKGIENGAMSNIPPPTSPPWGKYLAEGQNCSAVICTAGVRIIFLCVYYPKKSLLNFVDFEVLNPILWDENEVKFQIAPKQSCNELMS